jgi:hypothetical protein
MKKFSKPPKCLLVTFIGFSTCYESPSARLALERVREQGVAALCMVIE